MADFLKSINLFDVLVILVLFGFFILGYIQGTIRRLVGILSIVFSFFLAAQLDVPVGSFLADHWTQFPREYASMLGFLILFAAGVVAFSLVIQGTYRKAPLFADHAWVDETLGGVLGVVQGFLVLMFVTIILDQFFRLAGFPVDKDELPFLRDFWTAVNTSGSGNLLHASVIPGFITVTQFLIPESIRLSYGVG